MAAEPLTPTELRQPAAGAPRSDVLAAFGGFARRLIALILLLLLISFGIFALQDAAPGSTLDSLLGAGGNPSPQQIEALKAKYHLDDPFLTRYVDWLGGAVKFDFGDSVQSGEPVSQIISERIGVTAFLIVYAALIAGIGGISFGIAAALRKGTLLDRGLTMLGLTGISVPAFVTGLVLLYVFSVLLGWFPSSGDGVGFPDRLWHLTLPAIALATTTLGYLMRLTRTSMGSVVDQDYVTFAKARGLSRWTVLRRYTLRTSLIPVITASALVFTWFLTSTVLVEVTFNITGVGSLLVDAVHSQDVPVVQGLAMTIAIAVVITNVVVEILYRITDPRVRAS